MYTLQDLARAVFAYKAENQKLTLADQIRKLANALRIAGSADELKRYLRGDGKYPGFLRPEIVKGIDLNQIMQYIQGKIPKSKSNIHDMEEVVLRFTEYKGESQGPGLNLVTELVSGIAPKIKSELGEISSKEAKKIATKIIATKEPLNLEEEELLKKFKNDIEKIAAKWLRTALLNHHKKFIRDVRVPEEGAIEEIKGEGTGVAEKGKGKENEKAVEQLNEEVEEAKDKWDLNTVYEFIDTGKIDENKREPYRTIIKEVFVNGKGIKEVAKKIGESPRTTQNWVLKLKDILKKWFKEKGIEHKVTKLPPYQDYLPKGDNAISFEDFVEPLYKTDMHPKVKEMTHFLMKGNDWKKIPDKIKGVKEKEAENFYLRNFKKWYKDWYKDEQRKLKASFERSLVYAKKQVEVPIETIKRDTKAPAPKEKDFESTPQNQLDAVNLIINDDELVAEIHFDANYDKEMPESEEEPQVGQDVETVVGKGADKKWVKTKYTEEMKKAGALVRTPVDFKYKKYTAYLPKDGIDKSLKPVEYTSTQAVDATGKFTGTPTSRFLYDGVPGNRILHKKLDAYVKDKMHPEGVLPHGQSAVNPRLEVDFGVEYINDKLGKKEYLGFNDFFDA